jgi:hypothetical protein
MMPSCYDTPSFSAHLYVGTPVYKNVGNVDHVIPHASGMRFIVIGLWPKGSTQQLSASIWNQEPKSDMDGDSFVKC